MTQPEKQHLVSRSLTAVLWGSGGAVIRLLLQVGVQVILARMLGPQQYGIFAIGATVISFSAFFSDVGMAYGLIQKTNVTEPDVRFVFTWQVIVGFLTATAVWGLAGPIAAFFGEVRAKPVVEALSLLCFLNAIMAPALNLLKRALDFKTIQLANLAGYFIGYVLVGLPLAWAGLQVWALVWAWLLQVLIQAALLYRVVKHPLKPLLWYDDARKQAAYGGTVFATNLVNWCVNNIDRVVVGRVFGSREIGLYATSYNLLVGPTSTLLGIVQPVFFAASARVSDEQDRILTGYRTLLAGWAVVILPFFAALACVSETFILTVYGSAWHEAANITRPLALVMPCFLLFGLTTPLLWTGGRAKREFQLQWPMALIWLLVCSWAATISILAVAWAAFALSAARCLVVVGVAARGVGLGAAGVWRGVRGGSLLTLICCLFVFTADAGLQRWPVGARLLGDTVCGLSVWAFMLWRWPGLVGPELLALLNMALPRLPWRLQRLLQSLVRKAPQP